MDERDERDEPAGFPPPPGSTGEVGTGPTTPQAMSGGHSEEASSPDHASWASGGSPPRSGPPAPGGPPPWSGSPPAGATATSAASNQRRRRLGVGSGVAVVLVAAVVAAAVGAGVGRAVSTSSTSSTKTVTQTVTATPGPAVIDGASIPAIVHRLLPEVVSIDATGTLSGVIDGAPFGVGSGLSTGETFESAGTGMIVSTSGLVITNNHVIAGASSVAVTLDGTTKALPARIIGTDPSHDMALLQIDHPPAGLHPVTFGNSADLVPGDAVIAIGNALALSAGSPTVTSGIISALGRTVTATIPTTGASETLTDMIQTDAAINPGNSGGPLVDSSGDVVGMDTATAGDTSDGTQAVGIGFAIPSEDLRAALPGLEKGDTSGTPGAYLGVEVEDNTPALASEYGFVVSSGAVVVQVTAASPAQASGIVPGDIVVEFDHHGVTSATDLAEAQQHTVPGEKVPVVVYEGTTKKTLSVTLGTQPVA
jgi:S1-C subfamily serine protease